MATARKITVNVYRNGIMTQSHKLSAQDLVTRMLTFVESAARKTKHVVLRNHWSTPSMMELHQFTSRKALTAYDAVQPVA